MIVRPRLPSESVNSRRSRTKALLREMREARGYIYPEHAYLAETDPGFLDAYNNLVGKALLHGNHELGQSALPAKYRELVVCGILAYRGVAGGMLTEHVRRAMRCGASVAELLEAFEAAVVPGGAPTLFNGVAALIEVSQDPPAKGHS
jgi:alkylhydroperoxidase/carboxymuconolactone decarboxylase family protein YurZ